MLSRFHINVFLNKPFTQNISICDLFASKKPLGSLDAATVATPIFQYETSAGDMTNVIR
jgi:hypothetical protein